MKNRAGLTLLELVVVIAILAALAALIVPRLSGIRDQTDASVNMSLVGDLNRSIATYEHRFLKSPGTWDGLVPQAGSTLYSRLHPELASKLTVVTLTATQAQSLIDAGITDLVVVDPAYTGSPSDSAIDDFVTIAAGTKVPVLFKEAWTGHGTTFLDRAFNVQSSNPNEFVVLGVGMSSSLRGSAVHDAPIVQSVDPLLYYARALCVYKIPSSADTVGFKALYVGSFLPDGTCVSDNSQKFNAANRLNN